MATSTIFSWLRSKILQSSCRFLGDFGILNKIGFRELKNTDFKPKGPARILVRAIAADPTRTRSLNSPFQALHTQIVLRDAEARPGRPRLISLNRGQWDMELVERIAPAAIHRSPACGMRIRNKGDPQLDGTFISLNESSALPDVVRSAAGVSTTVWFAAPGLQTSVPTTLVIGPAVPVALPPFSTKPSTSKAPSPVVRLTNALPPLVVQRSVPL